jgi:hypothetical protein
MYYGAPHGGSDPAGARQQRSRPATPGELGAAGNSPGRQVLLRPPRPTQHPLIEVFSSQPVLESRPNPIRGVTELVSQVALRHAELLSGFGQRVNRRDRRRRWMFQYLGWFEGVVTTSNLTAVRMMPRPR